MSFSNLGLLPELLKAVSEEGYTVPTPIQKQAIPAVLSGSDILAGAQTGTGKTAAFILPLLQKIVQTEKKEKKIHALILTPTRELAAQIAESACTYGRHVKVTSFPVFGGINIRPQMKQLKSGVDILIATPGRLMDLASQNALDLSKIDFFVLDEADRMLDMGFIHDIKRIIKLLPHKRQNMMFSATYTAPIRELSSSILVKPVTIDVAPRNMAAQTVEQAMYKISKSQKASLLCHLVKTEKWFQILVFARTKHGVNKLAKQLGKQGINALPIHSNKSQATRTKALADFKKGDVQVLVATDIAARGLDIEKLSLVVNFDVPEVPEDYVHRIGRTGRAGETGAAISLVSPEEQKNLVAIERLLKKQIQIEKNPVFEMIADLPIHEIYGDRDERGRGRDRRVSGSGREKSFKRPHNSGRPASHERDADGRRQVNPREKFVSDRPNPSRKSAHSGQPTNLLFPARQDRQEQSDSRPADRTNEKTNNNRRPAHRDSARQRFGRPNNSQFRK